MPERKSAATHDHDSTCARQDPRSSQEPPLPDEQGSFFSRTVQSVIHDPGRATPGDILALQRLAGNRAVSWLIQAKPSIEDRASAEEGTFEAGCEVESRLAAGAGGGSSLSDEVRSYMEPRFGADFGGVRLHTGGEAERLSRDLSAKAFTHGQDIYLGAGAQAPGTEAGNRLLAHELAHVVQQRGAGPPNDIQRAGTKPRDFSTDGQYMVKLSSDREKYIYENRGALGLARVLPKYYPVLHWAAGETASSLFGSTPIITRLTISTRDGPRDITLKQGIRQPGPGQEVLCIEALGHEPLPAGSPKADKLTMDIKIGTETKSQMQYRLEGAGSIMQAEKHAEHGLKDWRTGSRGAGYDICDGRAEFENAVNAPTPEFSMALAAILGQVHDINQTLSAVNTGGQSIAFVGASVLCVFNLTRPENSVAKLIDPDHPILMDAVNAKIASATVGRPPADVMTAAHYAGVAEPTRGWAEYQGKWLLSFMHGLAQVQAFFNEKLAEVESRLPKAPELPPS